MSDPSTTWPAPDPVKLAAQFAEWTRGETLVGRMLANLKTGRLPEVLATAQATAQAATQADGGDASRAEVVAVLAAHWEGWERGTTLPLAVAEGLRDDGLEAFLSGVTDG